MASVHLGRLLGPVGFSRTVAIKRMHPHIAKEDDFVSMFIDEARLAARVRHPNVVQTLDVVQDGDELLLVMEYVHGAQLSLLQRLAHRSGQRIPVPIGAAIVAGMLRGLHAAHEATDERGAPLDLVHRDVSPHNVMVGVDGIPRVIDFGVAKAAGRLQQSNSNQLKGKVPYMAPEQVRGESITRRVDLFAAGVVLWECLCGRRLFDAENDAAIIGQVLSGEIPPPGSLEPNVPPPLAAAVMRALERNPARRFETARDFARAIEASVAVAPPAEVGEWVEAIAREPLAKRSALVAEIESAGPEPSTSSSARLVSASVEVRRAPSKRIINEPPPAAADARRVEPDGEGGRSVGVVAVIVAVVALIAAGGLIASTILRPPPEQVPTPSAASVPAPSASASAASTPSATATASAAPAAKPKPYRGPLKSVCDPPYYFDSNGVKRTKQQCL